MTFWRAVVQNGSLKNTWDNLLMSVAILVYHIQTTLWLTDLVILQGWGMAFFRMTFPQRQGVSMLGHMHWANILTPDNKG